MSQRSIVEFNHDQSLSVADHPVTFVTLLGRALASGRDEDWGHLRAFGVRRITQCHHSEDRKVVVNSGALQREYPFG